MRYKVELNHPNQPVVKFIVGHKFIKDLIDDNTDGGIFDKVWVALEADSRNSEKLFRNKLRPLLFERYEEVFSEDLEFSSKFFMCNALYYLYDILHDCVDENAYLDGIKHDCKSLDNIMWHHELISGKPFELPENPKEYIREFIKLSNDREKLIENFIDSDETSFSDFIDKLTSKKKGKSKNE